MNVRKVLHDQDNRLFRITPIWGTVLFFAFALEIINYISVNPDIVNDPAWSTRITEKCGPDHLEEAYQSHSMIDNGEIGFSFGGYFGCIPFGYQSARIFTKTLTDETKCRAILRLLVTGVLCIPVLLLGLIGGDQIGNVYVLMVLKSLIPTFGVGWIIFGIAD